MLLDFVLATSLFYTVTLICGMTLFILGYRLFRTGILGPVVTTQGTIDPAAPTPGSSGQVQFQIANVAPGTAFAILGAIVVGIGLWNGPQAISTAGKQAQETANVRAGAEERKAEAEKARQELTTAALIASSPSFQSLRALSLPPPIPGGSVTSGSSGAPLTLGEQKRQMEEEEKRLKKVREVIEAFDKLVEQKPLTPEERGVLKQWLLDQPAPRWPIR